jgi:hypothetical protein
MYLDGRLESLKSLRLQHSVALKRLASAVQLRPWPPHFKAFISPSNKTFQSALSPLLFEESIRSLGHHDYEELNSNCQILSPLLVRFCLRMAENGNQHCPSAAMRVIAELWV